MYRIEKENWLYKNGRYIVKCQYREEYSKEIPERQQWNSSTACKKWQVSAANVEKENQKLKSQVEVWQEN